MWTMDDGEGEVEVNLQKMKKGDTWNSAFEGHGQVANTICIILWAQNAIIPLVLTSLTCFPPCHNLQLNPFTKGEVQKQMMLERFQAEVGATCNRCFDVCSLRSCILISLYIESWL